ncbi:MAG TPA: ABC transporter ATP-binding protein [Acidimicrobiales bacterium]|nr:ABC transporter ATP-binding protein [Acidimicrobiales bacterium]
MPAAVTVEDLVVRYGEVTAVGGVSFDAHAAQVTAVLGPNGAGKTTTIETIEGYRRPTSGRARVLGLDPVRDRGPVRARIGVMLQSGGVYPTMGPAEALRLFAAYYPSPLDPVALLERVGLGPVATTPWRRLSGGEQRRLSLALALVGRPSVAFLDEPTAGVDAAGRIVIREVIRELRDDGVAVLLATHELDEASRLADQVVIVDHGRVAAAGTPAELMGSGGASDLRFGAQPGIDTVALAAAVGAPVIEAQPGEYVVQGDGSPERVAALTAWLAAHGLPLADLRAGRQTLEDVFLRLTGGGDAGPGPDRSGRRRHRVRAR